MNLFRLLGKGVLLLGILLGLTACGQKGPLILPPKNTPPQAVNPVVFPEKDAANDGQQALDGALIPESSEVPQDSQLPTDSKAPDSSKTLEDSKVPEGNSGVEDGKDSNEIPLGILPSTTKHQPLNAR